VGYLNEEGHWVVDEQDDRRRQFHSAAKDHFQALQERVDRPIEHAVGDDEPTTSPLAARLLRRWSAASAQPS
jgi:hypothetical protein